jgi:hypothetical protein
MSMHVFCSIVSKIFHQPVHWRSTSKVRTHSPSTFHPSRNSTSHVQVHDSRRAHSHIPVHDDVSCDFLLDKIFDEKLNWDARAKVHCWSEIDLRQLTRKKSFFTVVIVCRHNYVQLISCLTASSLSHVDWYGHGSRSNNEHSLSTRQQSRSSYISNVNESFACICCIYSRSFPID